MCFYEAKKESKNLVARKNGDSTCFLRCFSALNWEMQPYFFGLFLFIKFSSCFCGKYKTFYFFLNRSVIVWICIQFKRYNFSEILVYICQTACKLIDNHNIYNKFILLNSIKMSRQILTYIGIKFLYHYLNLLISWLLYVNWIY